MDPTVRQERLLAKVQRTARDAFNCEACGRELHRGLHVARKLASLVAGSFPET
jgi:hypothetical protein